MKRHLSSSIFLLALTATAFASHAQAQSTAVTAPGKVYVGVFGGSGSSNNFNGSQYGTAFYIESLGGPLAVNAFGKVHNKSAGFYGAQLGYQAQGIALMSTSQWTLGPAVELEGYSMSRKSFTGDLTNNTARLPEHDFVVTYPMSRSVFLGNAVLSLDNPCIRFHPYVGLGIGSGLVRISGADATQVAPVEAGVNHYNANTSDSNSAFAGQIKLGVSYDINQYVSVFADYRWLYLASTHFTFGSTVYAGHPETSSWQVKLDAQRYNMGNIGLRFNI